MRNFFLSTDSTADLYWEEVQQLNCGFLPLTLTIEKNGKTEFLPDNFKKYDDYIKFFERLKEKDTNITTSKNNTEIHREYFETLAKQGHMNVLHFTISYGLANTMDNAYEAAKLVKKDFPDFSLKVVESHTTTVGQGMLVKMAAKLADQGKSIDEVFAAVEEAKHRIQHFVMVDDLYHLKKGGRISGTAAVVGTVLSIKVVISFDKEGKLKVIKKIAGGKRKCINTILNDIGDFTFASPDAYPTLVHTGNFEFAQEFASLIETKYNIKPEIRIMGPTIACHVGPGAVAFAFLSNQQRPI